MQMDFRILVFSTLVTLFSLYVIFSIFEYSNTVPVYLPVFAQDNDVYFPDYLLTNNSETTNNDSSQSSESEGPLPADSYGSEGIGCIPSTLQNSNECFATYENSTYGIKINYPSMWNKVTPYSDEKYTTVFVQEFDKPDSSAYVIVGVDYFNFETTPSTYLARLIQNYRTQLQDFTLISSDLNSVQLAGIPGYEILYTFSGDNDEVILTRQLGAVIPGTSTAYQITYSAEVTEYPGSEENLNTMIDSIELNLRGANVTAPSNLQDLDYFIHVYDGGVI